tara:strand:+ start:350 stop:532 length:183 start_codon:yes stop_codon:yes gene_type:complete
MKEIGEDLGILIRVQAELTNLLFKDIDTVGVNITVDELYSRQSVIDVLAGLISRHETFDK